MWMEEISSLCLHLAPSQCARCPPVVVCQDIAPPFRLVLEIK